MDRMGNCLDRYHGESDQKPTERQEIQNTQPEQLHLPMDEVFVIQPNFVRDHS